MKKWVLATISLATLGVTMVAAQAQDVVKIAEPNWASGRAIAGLIKVIIETKLGGQAELVPGTNAVIFKAMDRGKGEIDVHPDVWMPNLEDLVDEYVTTNKTVVLSKNSYQGRSGFCLPKSFATQHNIKSVFDLATPEVSKLISLDDSGKGNIWVGDPAWTQTKINMVKIRDYGIANFFNVVETGEEVATAAISEAIAKNKGYAFYCYAPHYNWFIFDMVMLEEPAFEASKHKMVAPSEDPDWFEKSKITVGDPEKKLYVAYSKSLKSRTPAIAEFLSRIALDTDTVSGLTYEIVVKKRDSQEVAKAWIAKNGKRVEQWLGL
jgi:glycine betaine/proline transport system substrate-binding protein